MILKYFFSLFDTRMKLLIPILLIFNLGIQAQVIDNFNDSDLLLNPNWIYTNNNFSTLNKELRSNNSTINSTFNISTKNNITTNCIWSLDAKLLFNTSSVNYLDIALISDSSDITKMKNGYFVRLGGTLDEVSLFKTKNGIETKIIDGVDGSLNSANNPWRIKVTRYKKDSFVLERTHLVNFNTIVEGFAKDSDHLVSEYFGISIKQSTASFFLKHFFDNLHISKILKDTIPPICDSIILINANTLKVKFNEVCDTNSLLNILNYKITEGNINPILVNFSSTKKEVTLRFISPFNKNRTLFLLIKNIKDSLLNTLIDTALRFYYSKPDTAKTNDLLITELLPDPDPVVGLPNKEYVEITNNSKEFITLKGCKINDPSSSILLPDIILPPDSILVLYDIPSLNNASDNIWITNQKNEIIHQINYTSDWYKNTIKKNGGWSLEMIDVNYPCNNKDNWAASINILGGTPSLSNSIKGIVNDNITPKIIAYSPNNDTILELSFNKEIDSFYLTNLIFKLNNLFVAFKLKSINSSEKKASWLINFLPHSDSIYNISVSNLKDCSANLAAVLNFKLQWPSESKRNEIVINEILFNPKSGSYDFLELYNNSPKAFNLSTLFVASIFPNGQFKSIDKISSNAIILKPYSYLLLSQDTQSICDNYRCKNKNNLKINYAKMPSLPDNEGNIIIVNSKGNNIDSVQYSNKWHNPLISDENGVSLERLYFTSNSNSKSNWNTASSVSGFGTPGYINSQSIIPENANQNFILQSKTVSPDEDGFEDVLIINYNLPKPNFAATINIYNMQGEFIKELTNNETLSSSGFIAWNGTDFNNQKANIGIYIIIIECTNIDGAKIKEKLSCVVAGQF